MIGIVVTIIVLLALPQTTTVSVSRFEYDGSNLFAYVLLPDGTTSRLQVNAERSSFATSLLTDSRFLVQMNIEKLGNVFVNGTQDGPLK